MNIVSGKVFTTVGFGIEGFDQFTGYMGFISRAEQLKTVAAIAYFNLEASFNLLQVFVELSAQIGEAAGVVGLQHNAISGLFV